MQDSANHGLLRDPLHTYFRFKIHYPQLSEHRGENTPWMSSVQRGSYHSCFQSGIGHSANLQMHVEILLCTRAKLGLVTLPVLEELKGQ